MTRRPDLENFYEGRSSNVFMMYWNKSIGSPQMFATLVVNSRVRLLETSLVDHKNKLKTSGSFYGRKLCLWAVFVFYDQMMAGHFLQSLIGHWSCKPSLTLQMIIHEICSIRICNAFCKTSLWCPYVCRLDFRHWIKPLWEKSSM